MKKVFYCARCGQEIDPNMGAYVFLDNFLQIKFFEQNKDNRFCSEECACESLFLKQLPFEVVPLDDDEEEEDEEEEYEETVGDEL